MKKSILLFTLAAGLGIFTLSSYESGPAQNAQGNRTGSGSNPTCGAVGCHGANNTNTTITLTLNDQTTGQLVTKYTPGKIYIVTIGGSNSGASKFGFQLTGVKAANTNAQAGSFTQGTQTQVVPVNPWQVVEHSSPLGSNGTFSTTFTWAAPVTGTGPVTFYTIVNAVNGNGSADAGDHATTKSFNYDENTTSSVAELSQDIKIVAYPNPATDRLSFNFENATTGTYNIAVLDITGKIVHTQDVNIGSAAATVSIESANWNAGIYFARVTKDGALRMIPVVKQ